MITTHTEYLAEAAPVTLVTYQHVWTRKFRGEQQYEYRCTWSDGAETREMTLPWDRLDGAVELPSTSEAALAVRNSTQTEEAA